MESVRILSLIMRPKEERKWYEQINYKSKISPLKNVNLF